MIFRTYPEFGFKYGGYTEWPGDPPRTRHWTAFEWIADNFWFIIEFATEQGSGKDKSKRWRILSCTQLTDVLDIAQLEEVLEHRIDLVIPSHSSSKGQIELKPIQTVYSFGDNAYDLVTSDGARYAWPNNGRPRTGAQREIYFTQSVNFHPQSGKRAGESDSLT